MTYVTSGQQIARPSTRIMTAPSLLGMPASVITEFCSYLLPNKYSWGEKCISPELVALATTCRLLSEHALDVLWKELPSVVPLILTMPSDLIGWSTESYKHTTGRDAEVEVLVSLKSRLLVSGDANAMSELS